MTPSPLPLHSPASPPAVDTNAISTQQEDGNLLRESLRSSYDEAFENDITHILLRPNSPRQSQDQGFRKAREDPLPLTSSERIYQVSIPVRSDSGAESMQIKTTHPHGSIFGGPNPYFPLSNSLSQEEVRLHVVEKANTFVKEAGILSRKQLTEILDKQMEELMRQVNARSRDRLDAVKHNARVEEEKRVLEEENEMIRKGVMRNMGR
ncbi:hypothetical protein FKW77_000353 [Venturia effusa]|uniref:Uncharacterized protein n=1 Tax=Venturia effusa TaxID=50376 RepID=A0A517LD30_9PEZI|nr:hypothetical protein FKW77_000353 [Venturia effusa]